MEDYTNSYYDQLKDHYLEPLEIGLHVKSFYMRKSSDSRTMSTLLIFSPEGIIITGDCHPGRQERRGGVIARGYGLSWFGEKLNPTYLAEKFLTRIWVPSKFEQYVRDYISDQWRSRALDIKRKPWDVGGHQEERWTEARALKYLISNPYFYESAHVTYENLPAYLSEDGSWFCPFDYEFVSMGYGYDPIEMGRLAAIQKRFSELIKTIHY